MAVTELQGTHVGLYIRTYGSTSPFKRVVCEDTLTLDVSNDITTTKTKCGVFKGVDVTDWKINGTGVCNFNPGGSEISTDDLLDLQVARTKVEVFMQNEAFTDDSGASVSVGHVWKFGGGAFINSHQISAGASDPMKYTFSLEGVDDPNITES